MKRVLVFVLMVAACYSFAEAPETGREAPYGTLYYVCLGSFTVPANAAHYQLELADTGVETFTENVRVRGRWFTRVLYADSFLRRSGARQALNTLLSNSVTRKNNIRDLWVRSSIAPLNDDPVFSESISRVDKEITLPRESVSAPSPFSPETPPPPPPLDDNPYRTIHPEGYANCIFAAEPVQLG